MSTLVRSRKIAVIGLGYVGLPVTVAFARKQSVIAFDIDSNRIGKLRKGIDSTGEVKSTELVTDNLIFTDKAGDLKRADFFIVAVPTHVTNNNQPNLRLLLKASEMIALQLKAGDIVVYESTVYPGTTEGECVPVLEKFSGLKCGIDFFVGYSPERINPGDKERSFTQITKIVSGQTKEVLEIVASVYASVVTAGVYKAESIKIAEAAKVVENTQRDLNIAFINELAIILHELDIDTKAVLDAAGTKWNFLPFTPGLVGGHCISIDPYYLIYKAKSIGYHPEIISASRKVNNAMGKYIAEQSIKLLISLGVDIRRAKVGILGFTFKENCSDIRNTQVFHIVQELREYGIHVIVHDSRAIANSVKTEYGIEMQELSDFKQLNGLILAVAHSEYLQMEATELIEMLSPKDCMIVDVKSRLDRTVFEKAGIAFWRL